MPFGQQDRIKLLGKASGEISELCDFVELAWEGLGVCLSAPRMADVLGRLPQTRARYATEWAKKRAEKQSSRAKLHFDSGFRYLYGLAAVKLWSILETLVKDLATGELSELGAASLSEEVRRLRGPVIDFILADDDTRSEMLFALLEQDLKAKFKPGVGRFETVLESVGLSGRVAAPVRKALLELSVVRNVVVHQSTLLDKRALTACPWLGQKPGDPAPLSADRFQNYLGAAGWYVMELMRRCHSDGDVPNPGDEDDVAMLKKNLAEMEAELEESDPNSVLVTPGPGGPPSTSST